MSEMLKANNLPNVVFPASVTQQQTQTASRVEEEEEEEEEERPHLHTARASRPITARRRPSTPIDTNRMAARGFSDRPSSVPSFSMNDWPMTLEVPLVGPWFGRK